MHMCRSLVTIASLQLRHIQQPRPNSIPAFTVKSSETVTSSHAHPSVSDAPAYTSPHQWQELWSSPPGAVFSSNPTQKTTEVIISHVWLANNFAPPILAYDIKKMCTTMHFGRKKNDLNQEFYIQKYTVYDNNVNTFFIINAWNLSSLTRRGWES